MAGLYSPSSNSAQPSACNQRGSSGFRSSLSFIIGFAISSAFGFEKDDRPVPRRTLISAKAAPGILSSIVRCSEYARANSSLTSGLLVFHHAKENAAMAAAAVPDHA